jgi:hypothetical protein
VVRHAGDRRTCYLRQMVGSLQPGTWRQEPVREQMVDAPRERIARIVGPSQVERQTLLQVEQGRGPGDVDLTLERETDVGEGEQVLFPEELEDRADQRFTRRGVCLLRHARVRPGVDRQTASSLPGSGSQKLAINPTR